MREPRSEAERQEREEEQEACDRRTLLDFCYTEDEYREVQHGIEPAQVRRRYEAWLTKGSLSQGASR